MKTYSNLYDDICSFYTLGCAFRRALRGNRRSSDARDFELSLEEEIIKLHKELASQKYVPGSPMYFVIRDPKTRLIKAPPFRDRVVHQALCYYLEPIFDSAFISDSFASRRNKGTRKALQRFDEFKRKASSGGSAVYRSAKGNNMVTGYVLKADIRHYFDSIDHGILMKTISMKIKDERVMTLIKLILEHGAKAPGKGMPLGNLTSQLFANIYLNEMDYFVKHKLREEFYARYMDDFVILHKSQSHLKVLKNTISEFLITNLLLQMHPEKTKVLPLRDGVCFLGYRIFYRHKLLKKSNILLFNHRFEKLKEAHRDGNASKEKITESVNGWLAYAEEANTYKMCRRIKQDLRDNLR